MLKSIQRHINIRELLFFGDDLPKTASGKIQRNRL